MGRRREVVDADHPWIVELAAQLDRTPQEVAEMANHWGFTALYQRLRRGLPVGVTA